DEDYLDLSLDFCEFLEQIEEIIANTPEDDAQQDTLLSIHDLIRATLARTIPTDKTAEEFIEEYRKRSNEATGIQVEKEKIEAIFQHKMRELHAIVTAGNDRLIASSHNQRRVVTELTTQIQGAHQSVEQIYGRLTQARQMEGSLVRDNQDNTIRL